MKKKKIFVDSDVAISSLISSKGAAYFLLNEAHLNLFVSNLSILEIKRGAEKLKLEESKFHNLLKRLKVTKLRDIKKNVEKIKFSLQNYVFDENDAHILAGAIKARTKIILTYNLKHFKAGKILKDFKITILTPAQYLQYLRSID